MSPRHAPEIPGVELDEVIGTGGSGIVYRGRQVAFDRPVAVKVAAADGSDGTMRRAWEREVAAVGRLSNHPNVVPVFDAGVSDAGAAYLVMALVPGGTLGDRLRRDGPLEPAEVAEVGIKLAGALAAVHAAGVLHRDIKPDNVLWSPHGEPQLSDFGIARLADRTATLNTSVRATVSYAAPEVLAGGEATEATDVYGLGATLYACLTGHPPHPGEPGEHLAAAVARALEQDPAPLADAGIPAGLAAVVEQAISRDPARRQLDAARLRHDLERAAADLHGHDGPAPTAVVPPATATAVAPAAAPAVDEVATRPHAVVPAPARRPDPPAHGDVDRRAVPAGRGGGRTLWLAVLAVVALAVGLLVLQSMSDDDGDGDVATDTTTTTAAPTTEATEAPTTEAPTTAAPTTTEAPVATVGEEEPEPEEPEEAAGDPGEVAVTYLRTLDADDLEEAWAMTSSRFQAQQDREQWEGFWRGHDVEIVGDPRVDGGTVVVPITYDGQREDYRLDLVRQGGRWLIDGPVGR